MIRFILILIGFICSLFTIFSIPAKQLWYLAIAVTEFPWVWMIGMIILLFWSLASKKYKVISVLVSVTALVLFSVPIYRAARISTTLEAKLEEAFGAGVLELVSPNRTQPFKFSQMISGIGTKIAPFTVMEYANHSGESLTLNYTKSSVSGYRPCLVIVHGGSWKQGNSNELPDVPGYFAEAGYNVASINYRLAPKYKSPTPQEDLRAAINYLKAHAPELSIDPTNFVLMGRSAGGQIVLTAAYSFNDPAIKGVIDFYGPTDMFYAYNHPDAPLVMDSKKVMEDFFGSTPDGDSQAYAAGSPTYFITSKTVPTLIIHGGNDAHVHFDEAVLLEETLKEKGVNHFLLGLPWATHGCEYSFNSPSGQLAVFAEERFLAAVTDKKNKNFK